MFIYLFAYSIATSFIFYSEKRNIFCILCYSIIYFVNKFAKTQISVTLSQKIKSHLGRKRKKKNHLLLAKLSCVTVRKVMLKNNLATEFFPGIHQSLFQKLLEVNLTITKCLLHYWNLLGKVLPIRPDMVFFINALILMHVHSLYCTPNFIFWGGKKSCINKNQLMDNVQQMKYLKDTNFSSKWAQAVKISRPKIWQLFVVESHYSRGIFYLNFELKRYKSIPEHTKQIFNDLARISLNICRFYLTSNFLNYFAPHSYLVLIFSEKSKSLLFRCYLKYCQWLYCSIIRDSGSKLTALGTAEEELKPRRHRSAYQMEQTYKWRWGGPVRQTNQRDA